MNKAYCSKCKTVTSYNKEIREINFGFNGKVFTRIQAPLYFCNVCGSEVKETETFAIHEGIAKLAING